MLRTPSALEQLPPSIVSLKPPTKGWSITAIAIGLLVVVGVGGVGTTGLLQSYGIISLPKGIASALGSITKPGLWAMAVGGSVGGIIVIAGGSWKVHRVGQKVKEISQAEERLNKLFSTPHYQALGSRELVVSEFDSLPKNAFVWIAFGKANGEEKFALIRTQGGDLLATEIKIEYGHPRDLEEDLITLGYTKLDGSPACRINGAVCGQYNAKQRTASAARQHQATDECTELLDQDGVNRIGKLLQTNKEYQEFVPSVPQPPAQPPAPKPDDEEVMEKFKSLQESGWSDLDKRKYQCLQHATGPSFTICKWNGMQVYMVMKKDDEYKFTAPLTQAESETIAGKLVVRGYKQCVKI